MIVEVTTAHVDGGWKTWDDRRRTQAYDHMVGKAVAYNKKGSKSFLRVSAIKHDT